MSRAPTLVSRTHTPDDPVAGADDCGPAPGRGNVVLGTSTDPDQLGLWPANGEAAALPAASAVAAPDGGVAPRGGRTSLWARRALAGTAAVGLAATLAPQPAHALLGIPGIPDLVIDPAAIAQIVNSITWLKNQYRTQVSNLNAFVANTRKITSGYAFRDINTTLGTVNALVASGSALSYSTRDLAPQLAATYAGYTYSPTTTGPAIFAQRQRALSTVLQSLVANQATGQQLATSMARLNTMKAQLAGITTAQQAAELNATVAVTQAEETTLLRQQLLAATSAQQVVAAKEINDELQGAAITSAIVTRPVAALVASPPVRPRMTYSAYAW